MQVTQAASNPFTTQVVETSLRPGQVAGAYRVVRLLGCGGMAEVYEGEHETLGKRVAIKVMSQSSLASPIARERFQREGRHAAQVEHSNVVQVYDIGFLDDVPYLVMEYLPGHDLDQEIEARADPYSVHEALALVIPIAAGVAAGHDLGIVHRDLKPENVVLVQQGRSRVAKLLDFGVSRLLEGESVTQIHEVVGTPLYMAPEQARGEKPITVAADQYALGVLLYQLLTMALPHHGETMFDVLRAVGHEAGIPITQRRDDLDPALVAVLERALSAAVADRFPDLRSFARALLPFASQRLQAKWADELDAEDPLAEAEVPVSGVSVPVHSEVRIGTVTAARLDAQPPSEPPSSTHWTLPDGHGFKVMPPSTELSSSLTAGSLSEVSPRSPLTSMWPFMLALVAGVTLILGGLLSALS